jgi:long-subunit acyl-CoA synthetase (AMP-forming)
MRAPTQGVEIPHRALLGTTAALATFLDALKLHMDHNDILLSFLPLAHIFQRRAHAAPCSLAALHLSNANPYAGFAQRCCPLFLF